jgi:UDP-N-acetylmuramate dehydrogenase
LIERLPAVRGRLTVNAAIGKQTWFGVGGAAEILFRPADAEDLTAFLAALPAEIAVTVVGAGSNLLVRDGGIPGVTIRLGGGLGGIAIADGVVCVGAGALDRLVAVAAAKAGLAGLEFLSGIPGTIGGSLRMNAGAYEVEIEDVLVSRPPRPWRLQSCDRPRFDGAFLSPLRDRPRMDLRRGPAKRHPRRGHRNRKAANGDPRDAGRATQPIRAHLRSTFCHSPAGPVGMALVDAAGCRGLTQGGAMVSHKHANFLINTGSATAADIESLAEEVRRRVHETSGILLEWEIQRIGRPAPDPEPDYPSRMALQGRFCEDYSNGSAPL